MSKQPIIWVDSNDQLEQVVADWPAVIALDTEFIRTNTFYPMPGLYQICAADEVYLLDPTQIDQWQPFIDVLHDPHVCKVMHACLEDLELMFHHLGAVPQGIFDTQFANAFVSADFSLSYAALVNQELSIALPKHETRSNWLQRPLSEEQIQYAVEDVVYLIPLYQRLSKMLEAQSRHHWYAEDMQVRSYVDPSPAQYYLNIKKAWQLQPGQLGALQALCEWREQTARLENVPRNRVVWDDHLFSFARVDLLAERHIHRSLPRGVARRYGEALVMHHAAGRQAQSPAPLPKPLSSAQGALLKQLREIAREKAEQQGVAIELLARKKDLEYCIRHYAQTRQLSPYYAAWREELLAEPFLSLLNGNRV